MTAWPFDEMDERTGVEFGSIPATHAATSEKQQSYFAVACVAKLFNAGGAETLPMPLLRSAAVNRRLTQAAGFRQVPDVENHLPHLFLGEIAV